MTARVLPLLLAALSVPAMTLAGLPAHAFDLDELETRLAAPDRLQGHFRQLHWLADQELRLHSQGRFLFQRDQQLIWLFESPSRQLLSFTPGQVSYGPATEGESETSDIQALMPTRSTFQRHLVALMGGNFSALAEDYRLALSGDSDAWRVTLQPRVSTLELPLTTLSLSGTTGLERLDMAIANGDTLTIRLSDSEEVINESLVPWLATWLTGEPLAPADAADQDPARDDAVTDEAREGGDGTGSEAGAPRKDAQPPSP